MKILTIAPTTYFFDRGCHIRIFLEAKYLQKLGAEVCVCTYHLGKDIGGFKIRRIGKVDWYRKTSPGFAWGKLWLDLKLLWLCLREFQKGNFNAIHAHQWEGLFIGWLVKVLSFSYRTPIVFDLQGDLKSEFKSYNSKNSYFLRSFFVGLSKIVIKMADFVVLSSENAIASVKTLLSQGQSVEIVADGVDLELFQNTAITQAKWLSELNSVKNWAKEKQSKVLIYTGGMEDSKGVLGLLNEFIKIKQKNNKINWKLLLYGAGSDKFKYQKLLKSVDVETKNSVRFIKENSLFALPAFLKVADLAIDPKKASTESSGKLMNYMAAKLPIICFDSKFNRKYLRDKGIYLKSISELEKMLQQAELTEIDYDFQEKSQEYQVRKLFDIFNSLVIEKK